MPTPTQQGKSAAHTSASTTAPLTTKPSKSSIGADIISVLLFLVVVAAIVVAIWHVSGKQFQLPSFANQDTVDIAATMEEAIPRGPIKKIGKWFSRAVLRQTTTA